VIDDGGGGEGRGVCWVCMSDVLAHPLFVGLDFQHPHTLVFWSGPAQRSQLSASRTPLRKPHTRRICNALVTPKHTRAMAATQATTLTAGPSI
jgi:hypothetical protein